MNDELWDRLEAFTFDRGDPVLPLSARLARENGWAPVYAERVLDEYRRFVYLAVRAGHPVTPSEPVDQAWHMHLVYTRSYWDDLCARVLKRPLHHEPTSGGAAASRHYRQQYAETLASYARVFGHAAPADIWPSVEQRFGDDLRCVRVNTRRALVIDKRRLAVSVVVVVALLGVFSTL